MIMRPGIIDSIRLEAVKGLYQVLTRDYIHSVAKLTQTHRAGLKAQSPEDLVGPWLRNALHSPTKSMMRKCQASLTIEESCI